MSTIILGPIVVAIPLTVSENSIIDFEAKAGMDLLEVKDLSGVSVVKVRIENPNAASVVEYVATVTDAANGLFSVTLTGASHTATGKGRGRALFDDVTVPLSRFEIEWEDTF